ncbi:MAG: SMP-30/gluconolactonase/LRE family protein [Novosphingobium sp.]|nr:SMP-30/gluconolactonase/LRE family protein [Novosphingobium sp.]
MERLLEGGHFFEGARWRDGHWWVSDLYAHHVLRIAPDGSSQVVARLDCQPSGLGWLPDGRLLIVAMQDFRILRLEGNGTLVTHADLRDHVGFWPNDMVVARKGYAYVSNLGFNMWVGDKPEPADLICVAPDGSVTKVADNLLFPNGMVVTPDGKTLVVAETFGNRMSAFSIGDNGVLSNRRLFAEFGPPPSWASVHDFVKEDFGPDGCAVDAEGCVWVADALHNRICRVADGGQILEELRTPENFGIYSCALGGSDGHSLLLCAAPDYAEEARKAKAEAVLYVKHVAVPAAVF